MMFILDMGSGNTCQNDTRIIERMIREIAEIDKGVNKVILKWQLFNSAPPNIPLTHESFKFAYDLAERLCFETTSSVFDLDSMRYLMQFKVPFVKIANRPDLYELEKYSTVPVYISTSQSGLSIPNAVMMACISRYPATIQEYENQFNYKDMEIVSDHTVGWGLYHKYYPKIIEKHYVHERDYSNPDAGLFSVTQAELDEVINT